MEMSLKCPVCGNAMPNTICNRCGFTRFLFPKELPPQVEKFEQTRIKVMRKCRKNITEKPLLKETEHQTVESKDVIVGTLIIRNLMSESIHAYPIKEGKNIYGSREANSSVRVFIDPLIIGFDLPEIMFGINATVDSLMLIPNKDYELSHNRYIIDRIMDLESDDYFFHSNVLGFNAVRF